MVWLHQSFIKATTLFILTRLFGTTTGNYRKLQNGLILSLKFYFGKKNKLR